MPTDVVILPDGTLRCVYDDRLDFQALGRPSIERASHVEPNIDGEWLANLSPVGGPCLGPFPRRSLALAAEHDWLVTHWLLPGVAADF